MVEAELAFTLDEERLDFDDDERKTAGTTEMISVLVNKWFDVYRDKGGKLGRLAFVKDCLGSSGGVERIYVEEGLTPSGQQLGAWYYERASEAE